MVALPKMRWAWGQAGNSGEQGRKEGRMEPRLELNIPCSPGYR